MNSDSSENKHVKISLKPFLHNDIEKVIHWVPTPDSSLQLQQDMSRIEIHRKFFKKRIIEGNLGNTANLLFKAVNPDNQQIIGYCELHDIDEVNRSAELSHVFVGPMHLRGLGIDTKIVHSAMRIAFQVLKLHRLFVKIIRFDQTSLNLYQSLGFQKEGKFPESFRHNNTYWDLLQLGILRSRWESLYNSSNLN